MVAVAYSSDPSFSVVLIVVVLQVHLNSEICFRNFSPRVPGCNKKKKKKRKNKVNVYLWMHK